MTRSLSLSGSAGLTHLFCYQEVIAQGPSGADGAQQEDKDDVQKPPARNPRAEQSCHLPLPNPVPTHPTPPSLRVPEETCPRGQRKAHHEASPACLGDTSSTFSPLAYSIYIDTHTNTHTHIYKRIIVLPLSYITEIAGGEQRPTRPLGGQDAGRG